MQKSMRFLRDLGSVFGWLWGCFWDPGPSKISVSCKRGLIFKKSSFWSLGWHFVDLVTFWDALGNHFGSQSGAKMASKFNQKNDWFLDRSWKGSGAPKWVYPGKNPPAQDPRGGLPLIVVVNPGSSFSKFQAVGAPRFFNVFLCLALPTYLHYFLRSFWHWFRANFTLKKSTIFHHAFLTYFTLIVRLRKLEKLALV